VGASGDAARPAYGTVPLRSRAPAASLHGGARATLDLRASAKGSTAADTSDLAWSDPQAIAPRRQDLVIMKSTYGDLQ